MKGINTSDIDKSCYLELFDLISESFGNNNRARFGMNPSNCTSCKYLAVLNPLLLLTLLFFFSQLSLKFE